MADQGKIQWTELATSAPDKAVGFYRDTLGYDAQTVDMGEGDYHLMQSDGTMHFGIYREDNPDLADRFIPYMGTDDVDARVKSVEAAGGTVLREPWDVPGVGRMALVRDCCGTVAGWMVPSDDQQAPS